MRQIHETLHGEAAGTHELSDAQRAAVLAEMNSILSDPVFRRSQRCVGLLRCLIEHALAGDRAGIKERTLGVEVFGRDCDYDSNSDPIVRMTANEIRKRLAQYYQNNDLRHGVKIRLVPGRYIPEFDFPPPVPLEAPEAKEVKEVERKLPVPEQSGPGSSAGVRKPLALPVRVRWVVLGILLLAAIAAALTLGRSRLFPSAQALVWKPLMQSSPPLIICVSDNSALQNKGQEQLTIEEKRVKLQRIAEMIQSREAPAIPDPVNFDPTTPFVDANVAHEITSWLGGRGQPTTLRPSSVLSLKDLRNRPAVLVGGFDNPWTVILLSDMRFSLRVDAAAGLFWISDSRDPARRAWVRHVLEEAQPAVDYAVITRFLDAETDSWILAIAGLGPHGTEAASQLLIDPAYARSLPAGIRSAQNFQIVVSTRVINGNTGPPQVVAFQAW